MPHGHYTSQGRCAQSTPPSSAQRRPTLAPVTEVPSEFQYYHNMSLVVSPHPGAKNYTTAAPAQSRRPAIVDAWSNPNLPLETLVLTNAFDPAPYQSAPIGWRELALSTTRIRPSVDTTFGMLDMISSAFTPPGRNSLHESCSIEMPNFMPLADCSRGPAMREQHLFDVVLTLVARTGQTTDANIVEGLLRVLAPVANTSSVIATGGNSSARRRRPRQSP
ncbi:hypothetical protein K525DRAFT_263305 [Schizophyllum commune Loenen D]|nr:hypothetical protein K525DRAFT_263305 [Schizophyllum commune Loenen D]